MSKAERLAPYGKPRVNAACVLHGRVHESRSSCRGRVLTTLQRLTPLWQLTDKPAIGVKTLGAPLDLPRNESADDVFVDAVV